LIVEDDYDLALNLKEQIFNLGFIVSGVFNNAEETLEYLETHEIDLLLVDLKIMGSINGVGLVKRIHLKWNLPVIFLTAHAEGDLFNSAIAVNPEAYLVKPYEIDDLKTSLWVAFSKFDRIRKNDAEGYGSILKVRENGSLVFLNSSNIIMVKAEGLYSRIFTTNKTCVVNDILKNIQERLPNHVFLRAHKSYLINVKFIFHFNGKFAKVGDYKVPLRRGLFTYLKEVLDI
jgi:two-component system, LytTR family, response regulator LytT